MSEIEIKVKEKIKPLEESCDKLVKCLNSYLDKGIHDANVNEVMATADIIKDLCEAKEKEVKSMYYMELLTAMEESEYGEDYNEDGPMRKGYRGRSATTGRYVHRPYTEVMRDMDMPRRMYYGGEMQSRDGENRSYKGDMHSYPDGSVAYYGGENRSYMHMMEDADRRGYERGYTDGMSAGKNMNSGNMSNSPITNARRGYEEAKEKGDKEERARKLNDMMTSIKDEIKPMLPEMDVSEKSIVRNGLQTVQNMVM